jgi:hypothetical protein
LSSKKRKTLADENFGKKNFEDLEIIDQPATFGFDLDINFALKHGSPIYIVLSMLMKSRKVSHFIKRWLKMK